MPSSRKETAAADITAFAAGAGPPEKIIPTRLIEFFIIRNLLYAVMTATRAYLIFCRRKAVLSHALIIVLHAHALFNNGPLILKGSVEWDYSGIGLII